MRLSFNYSGSGVWLTTLLCLATIACSPAEDTGTSQNLSVYTYSDVEFNKLAKQQKVYVPAYSDIYHLDGNKRFLLTVTAVVRNTSLQDSVYVNKVDFFDSKGTLIRTYVPRTIAIGPLASAEFIVEYQEKQGGAGASFIIDWGSQNVSAKPLIQAVMIGTLSQQGISFITEGIVIQNLRDSTSVSK